MTRGRPEIDFSRVPIGSISTATHRYRDLIPAFMGTLGYIGGEAADAAIRIRARYPEVFSVDQQDFEKLCESGSESLGWLVMDLEDALRDCAPGGHYFGAHIGDGADFGFWPFEEGN